jgi:large subunit ribosomal protein L9
MAIEVLLRRSVETLGRVGEVVRVRPGYARNYLFPHGLAVPPTKENLRLVEKDKAVEVAEEADRARQRAELVAKITGLSLTIEAKSNPEGHLFGSVTAKNVADALVAKGFATIEERNVRMEHVKELGEFEITLHLAADAETKLKLWVVDEVTKLATKKSPEEQAAAAVRAEKDAARAEKAQANAAPKADKKK